MLRLLLLIVGSVAILSLSWRSMQDRRSHGFYRFFAFEMLLALILLNSTVWFKDSLSLRQLISYSLGVVSILLAVEGFRLLRIVGKPSPEASEKTNLAFENTTNLVTVGAYRFIRHPLYASLLALAWCAYLKAPLDLGSVLLAAGVTGFLLGAAISEERENIRRFGSAYADYMTDTRRFVPFLF